MNKKKYQYSSREEEIRKTLSFEDVLTKLKSYDTEYATEIEGFDAWDQLLACEALIESTPVNQELKDTAKTNESVSVNGMSNGTYKRKVNFELTPSKHKVIVALKNFNHKTPPKELAILLEELFFDNSTKEGHWLYIAQHWNPRAIIRTIADLLKRQETGKDTIQNPAAYFTRLIKYRKMRRSL